MTRALCKPYARPSALHTIALGRILLTHEPAPRRGSPPERRDVRDIYMGSMYVPGSLTRSNPPRVPGSPRNRADVATGPPPLVARRTRWTEAFDALVAEGFLHHIDDVYLWAAAPVPQFRPRTASRGCRAAGLTQSAPGQTFRERQPVPTTADRPTDWPVQSGLRRRARRVCPSCRRCTPPHSTSCRTRPLHFAWTRAYWRPFFAVHV